MNKLFCFLTGGHKYKDKDLIVTDICIERKFVFENKCIKCGKIRKDSLDYDQVFKEWMFKKLD